jgi:tRNA-splicing ligase RtcB
MSTRVYGFPIAGVAATALPDGAISPGGVGYDINCGVRVLTSHIPAVELRPHLDRLMTALFKAVPTGVGGGGIVAVNRNEALEVLAGGAGWALRRGYALPQDVAHTEDGGCMSAADPAAVSARALERGSGQVGSLGSGNHFLEIDEIVEIYDPEAATCFGLAQGQACVWIHCGSRGLGHQICTDAVNDMQQATAKYRYTLPDRELACVPFGSAEGRRYYAAMSAAANYAWANRQVIAHRVREVFADVLGPHLPDTALALLYDVCHNIAKVEEHTLGEFHSRVCVHRKGATRAFGPGHPAVPADYAGVGQPVLIPGSMGTGSYILAGTARAMAETFGSTCHGAGRSQSRAGARRDVSGEALRAALEAQEIAVRAGSLRGLAEEAPSAYKDVDDVVRVVDAAGLTRRIARTRPMGVIKG